MRDFSDEFKMSVRSLPELRGYLASLVAEMQGRGFRFAEQALTREMVVNALIAYLRSLDSGVRDRLLIAAFAQLRELLEQSPEKDLEGHDLAVTAPGGESFVPGSLQGPIDDMDNVRVTRKGGSSVQPKRRQGKSS